MEACSDPYFEEAARLVGLDEDLRQILCRTANEITVNFPVKTDDGRVEMFRGYRVQHNNARGPFLGGLRFHTSVDLRSMRTLAAKRTWQASLVGIPFGGAMGGIRLDPSAATITELERITRRFVFALGNNIGPEYDIMAPDVNTNAQIMTWILDTYASTVPPHERNRCTHVVTGKPVEAGGSLGRSKAVGQGIVFLIQQWASERSLDLSDCTYILQGFGGVGSWVARLLRPLGVRLVAVEDLSGAVADPGGIDTDDLLAHVEKYGGIHGFAKAVSLDHEAFLKTEATILIPVAVGTELDEEAAGFLRVSLVAEGACCPVDRQGDRVLRERGVDVLPDLLCNSGGALGSYFEWLQNKRGERWPLEEVDLSLRKKILLAYKETSHEARDLDVSLRTAAMVRALGSLQRIYMERGIFP